MEERGYYRNLRGSSVGKSHPYLNRKLEDHPNFRVFTNLPGLASLDQEGSLLVSSIIKKLNSKGCSFLFTSHTSSNIDSREILLDSYS